MAVHKYYVLARTEEIDGPGDDTISLHESDADLPVEYTRREYMVTTPLGLYVRTGPFITTANNNHATNGDGDRLAIAYGQTVEAYGYYPHWTTSELWVSINEEQTLFVALKYANRWLTKEV